MFKLIEIEFKDHPFFQSLPIKFVGENEETAKNYTTLIIGPNGTGKSQILLAIINIFNSLGNDLINSNKKYLYPYKYTLKFTNNSQIQKVEYNNQGLFINGQDYRFDVKYFSLPIKLIVSAFSFNDKYPLRENRGRIVNDNYHYLGLKSTNNNIFINNPAKETIYNLYSAILNKKDITPIKDAFLTLGLKPKLSLIYKPGKNFKFLKENEFWDNKKLSSSQFNTTFSKFINSKIKSKIKIPNRFGSEKVKNILANNEDVLAITNFLNEHIRILSNWEKSGILLKPFIEFDNESTYSEFTRLARPFRLLSDLEIISFDYFEINKLENNFSFEDSSSGEYHILFTFLNILSLLEDNSIVLIDEPEISLHPNWQIKYMDIFNKVFKHFPNTHFILASHSHFMVSDLGSKNSSIISLGFNSDGQIKNMLIPKNTYGWSAEQILVDVFKVATTRNYYISRTITDVLNEMSNETPNFKLIESKLESIVFLNVQDFNEHDPLLNIFKELKEFYFEIKNGRNK